MKKETLERANKISEEIDFCEKQIEKLEWTLLDHVKTRNTTWKIETESEVRIPEDLFRTFGKFALFEYQQKLSKLQKEFDEL